MKVLKAHIILSPQQVEEGLRILELLDDVGPSLVNLFLESGNLNHQVGVGFGQHFDLTGNTFKLAHFDLLDINLPIKGTNGLLVHLQLVCPLSQTSPQTLNNCLLDNAPNLKGFYPHQRLKNKGWLVTLGKDKEKVNE